MRDRILLTLAWLVTELEGDERVIGCVVDHTGHGLATLETADGHRTRVPFSVADGQITMVGHTMALASEADAAD